MKVNLMMYFIYFLMSSFMFTFFFKHILLTLISLEFMMINSLLNIYLIFMILKLNMISISLFLTISVSESILGLSLLVFIVRMSGNDYLKMLNLMKW